MKRTHESLPPGFAPGYRIDREKENLPTSKYRPGGKSSLPCWTDQRGNFWLAGYPATWVPGYLATRLPSYLGTQLPLTIPTSLLNLIMDNVKLLVLFLTIACLLFLVIGLFRPWAMLWWEDVQNRSKVIKSYGSLAVFFGIMYRVLVYYYP